MEVIAVISFALLCVVFWHALAIKDGVEQLNARLNNIDTVLAAYYKMLKELQPKPPVEIPARLDEETVKEMIPGLFRKPSNEVTKEDKEYIDRLDKSLKKVKGVDNLIEEMGKKYNTEQWNKNGVDEMFDRMAEEDARKRKERMDNEDDDIPPPNEALKKASEEYTLGRLMQEYNENVASEQNEMMKEYEGVLKSGMFWEWYPELTGNWEQDKKKWVKIYTDLRVLRKKYKEEQEYTATEGSALHYISKEEARMMTENIKQRKKRSLNK